MMRAPILLLACAGLLLSACGPPRRVMLRLEGGDPEALVTIDDRYIGKMKRLQAGIKLPPGEHRVTVEKVGAFPYDKLIEADEAPITLPVKLTPIPD